MYGMVNQAVRAMVLERYGQATWTSIHTAAGAPETFSPMEPYDDSVTYSLVERACHELSLEPQVVLRAFGEYWVAKIATVHYERIMNSSGVSFTDFLGNLDHMHQRIRVAFPAYDPPSFRTQPIDASTLQLDYYSRREGLLPFVEGLLQGLAVHFSVRIEIQHIDNSTHRLPCKRMVVRHWPLPPH
jgi:hypothetical protein